MEPISTTLAAVKEIYETAKTIQKVYDVSKQMKSVAESEGIDQVMATKNLAGTAVDIKQESQIGRKEPSVRDIKIDESYYHEDVDNKPYAKGGFVDRLDDSFINRDIQSNSVAFVDEFPQNGRIEDVLSMDGVFVDEFPQNVRIEDVLTMDGAFVDGDLNNSLYSGNDKEDVQMIKSQPEMSNSVLEWDETKKKCEDTQLPSVKEMSERINEDNEISLDDLSKERPDIYDYIVKTKERLGNNDYANSIKVYKVGDDEYILKGSDDRPQEQSNFAFVKGKDVYCWSGNTNGDGHLNEFLNNERMMPNCRYHIENATYVTDDKGRVTDTYEHHEKGTVNRFGRPDLNDVLDSKGGGRNDVGGHIVAHNVDGASEAINIVPMDENFNNSGSWKSMEAEIHDAYQNGKESYVHRHLEYEGDSLKPSSIDVEYEIDGQKTEKHFDLP